MIDMQYNFPLLPGQPGLWRARLAAAVGGLGADDSAASFAALRPSFRTPHPELVHAAAAWLRLPSGRLTLTHGAHHGSLLAMLAAGLAGRPLAADAAAYTGALEQARALGSPVLGCRVDAEGMTPESLRAVCLHARDQGRPVAAVFLTPTVHNPLGCTASLDRRQDLVSVARQFDLLLLEDDTYAFLHPEPPLRFWDLAPERTFYINTLSKSFAPAARTGFLAAPERFAPQVASALKNTATGTSLPHQIAACGLMADGTLDRLVAAKTAEGRRRNHAARALLGVRCRPGTTSAWHLWVDLPPHREPQSLEATMREHGVLVSGGNWFATCPDAPHGIRVALGGEVDPAIVQRGVEILAAQIV